MSSQRYSETRTFNDNSRDAGGYDIPFHQRAAVPVQYSTNLNEQHALDRIRQQDTTVQWVNDPISGREKFRVNIDIDGFDQNEVNIRVDGNKLIVYGEHKEDRNQSVAKKIIEKSYELPRDIDTFSPHVTFPTLTKMQVDFPSRHSNVIIDDGRTSNRLTSSHDTTLRTSPRFSREKSSSEYTTTRKVGGGLEPRSSPRAYSTYDELYGGNNAGPSGGYSSTSHYQSGGYQSPLRREYISSTTDSFNNSTNPTYTHRVTTGDSQPRSTYPLSSRGGNDNVYEKTYTETHNETSHRRSSPTTGVTSSREVEHKRSGSPSIATNLDENRFRSSVSLGGLSMTPPSSSRNVEVREYSRRIGSNANDNYSFDNNRPSLFTQGFNSDAFYRSAFQPQIFTDDRGDNRVEMKLDVQNYQPDEIKVSVSNNDLIVQAEHNVNRPPTSTSRAYFYKQVTLPSNVDLNSISSQYHADGRLHITAKLNQQQPSIRYN